MTHASLNEIPDLRKMRPGPQQETLPTLKRYSVYAAMLVHEGLRKTREILTDYRLYVKMIPYIDRADYTPSTHLLHMEGGIWKWRQNSLIRFDERGDRWIHYEIIAGHFTGLNGDIYFEPEGEKGTAVYMTGALDGRSWPPAIVLERGAEIVFGYTGAHMRSYIESQKQGGGEGDQKSGLAKESGGAKAQDQDQSQSQDQSKGQSQSKGQGIPRPRSHL